MYRHKKGVKVKVHTVPNDFILSGISDDRLPRLAAPSLRQGLPHQPVPSAEQAPPAVQADLRRLHRLSQHRQVQRHQHPPLQEGSATLHHCCGSGSAPHGSIFIWLSWIRIRIGNADPDSGAWKLAKINK